jgi:hypothetical protein
VDLLKAGTVEGCIEGDKFMTGLFRERLQESVRDKLHSEGIVGELSDWKYHQRGHELTAYLPTAVSTLREGHVVNPEQWANALHPELQLLADHFVSPQMIETIRDTVLEKVGWLQVSEIKVCFVCL